MCPMRHPFKLAAVLLLGAGGLVLAQEQAPRRQMAITIDDLPLAPGNRPTLAEAREVNEKLLAVLERFRVPAIGFVNERKLRSPGSEHDASPPDPERIALLTAWLDAGLSLGNHGFSHLNLHGVETDVWERDIPLGERVLRPLAERHGKKIEFFRHPFLRTGRSVAIRDRTTSFLDRHGYRVAPVTIDNQEWVFGFAYYEARDDADLRRRIGRAYVDYMKSMFLMYEERTLDVIGEPIPHVLLIHIYALNADWLGEILGWLRDRDYAFIPLEQALEHRAYRQQESYTDAVGISWLYRWGLEKGMPRSAFDDEPDVPEWIQELTR